MSSGSTATSSEPRNVGKLDRFWMGSCGIGTSNYKLYFFSAIHSTLNWVEHRQHLQSCTRPRHSWSKRTNATGTGRRTSAHDTPARTAIRRTEGSAQASDTSRRPGTESRNAWGWNCPATTGAVRRATAYVLADRRTARQRLDEQPALRPGRRRCAGRPTASWDERQRDWTDIKGTITVAADSRPSMQEAIQSGPQAGRRRPPTVLGVKRIDKKPLGPESSSSFTVHTTIRRSRRTLQSRR